MESYLFLYFSLCMYFNLFLSFFLSLPLSLYCLLKTELFYSLFIYLVCLRYGISFFIYFSLYIYFSISLSLSLSLSLCLFETGLFYNLLSIRLFMCRAKSKLNLRILASVFTGAHAQFYRKLCVVAHWFLGRLVFGEQYRPRSDAAEQFCGVWSGSTLFYWLF